MLPLLRLCGDKKEHKIQKCYEHLAREFDFSDEELNEYVPSGQQSVFVNRVSWARTYLKKAGLLQSPRRGTVEITERGLRLLETNPGSIDRELLCQYEEFLEFISKKSDQEKSGGPENGGTTPLEMIENGCQTLRDELASDILAGLKSVPPAAFEKMVAELLVKMGYGGTLRDAGCAVGKSGGGGIDGILKEDRLGLDVIHVQAKRWEGTVSRPEVQRFAGALQMQRARKGVFIATSAFAREALEYVKMIESQTILIGGEQLAQYMIDFNLGVTVESPCEIKRIDSDYFSGD